MLQLLAVGGGQGWTTVYDPPESQLLRAEVREVLTLQEGSKDKWRCAYRTWHDSLCSVDA